jgi:hypothetical protein
MNKRLKELLYRSFEQELSNAELSELEKGLSSSTELAEEKKRIAAMRHMLEATKARSFKPFFSSKVINRIKAAEQEREGFLGSLVWSFRLVTIVGAVTIVLLFAYNALDQKSLSLDSLLAMPQIELQETWELDILTFEEDM